jgi:hypothetical protein
MCISAPPPPNAVYYIHTLHFISQVQTNGHKNRHIKTKQAPVNKITLTSSAEIQILNAHWNNRNMDDKVFI